jgi:hypothetical protein
MCARHSHKALDCSPKRSVLAELGHSQIQNRPFFTQNLMQTADLEPTSEWCRFQGTRNQIPRPVTRPLCRADEAVVKQKQVIGRSRL